MPLTAICVRYYSLGRDASPLKVLLLVSACGLVLDTSYVNEVSASVHASSSYLSISMTDRKAGRRITSNVRDLAGTANATRRRTYSIVEPDS